MNHPRHNGEEREDGICFTQFTPLPLSFYFSFNSTAGSLIMLVVASFTSVTHMAKAFAFPWMGLDVGLAFALALVGRRGMDGAADANFAHD